MYEAHFGMPGRPFQLSPDPEFFFASRGHGQAQDLLARVLREGTAWTVVTGGVGVGKTLLWRTVLGGLDEARYALVTISQSQLNADELREAVALQLGRHVEGARDAGAAGSVQAALGACQERGLRVLILVDEAQNLADDGFEWLRTTIDEHGHAGARAQVVLFGQPELTTRLASGRHAAFAGRHDARLHLGPLAADEVRDYVEHRLRTAGWNGRPAFDDAACDEVARRTGGVPRRINLLCNRLMLSRCLAGLDVVDFRAVVETDSDIDAPLERPSAAPQDRPGTAVAEAAGTAAVGPETPRASPAPAAGTGPLMCIVCAEAEHVQAAALMRAFARFPSLADVRLVRLFRNDALERNGELFGRAGVAVADATCLDIRRDAPHRQSVQLLRRLEAQADLWSACGLLVFGGAEMSFDCAVLAQAKGMLLVHVDGGQRHDGAAGAAAAEDWREIDFMSDCIFVSDPDATSCLAGEGVELQRVLEVGHVLVDALRLALRPPAPLPERIELPLRGSPVDPESDTFGLVILDRAESLVEPEPYASVLSIVRQVSRDLPLIWLAGEPAGRRAYPAGLEGWLRDQGIGVHAAGGFVELAGLMTAATLVLTDSWNVQVLAKALNVPCLVVGKVAPRRSMATGGSCYAVGTSTTQATRAVWDILYNGDRPASRLRQWDGHASDRIAGHLAAAVSARRGVRDVSLHTK